MGQRVTKAAREERRVRNASKREVAKAKDPKWRMIDRAWEAERRRIETAGGFVLVDVRPSSAEAAKVLASALDDPDPKVVATRINAALDSKMLAVVRPAPGTTGRFRRYPDGRLEALGPDAPEPRALAAAIRNLIARTGR